MPIEQMEVTITRPIEQAVNSVPGLESVRSMTSRGSAEIDLFFNWNVNMIVTLQMVDAAVSRIQSSLPATAKIETHRMDFSSFPIIGYSLTSDKVPQTDLWELATYDIKPRLNRLNGVANVLVQGGQEPEFHVTVDPAKMLRTHVSVSDILAAINHTNIIDSPGLMSRNHQLFLGLVNGQVHNPDEIGDIVIKNVNNVPVRVGDIGAVGPAVAPVYTAVSANGKPAVLLSINRQPDSNTVQVADEVHNEMEAIRPSLPAGVDVRPFYDQSNIVNESIASVRDAIIIGLLLAGFDHLAFLAGLGYGADDGIGRSGDDGRHVHRDEAAGPEFQPHDAGRPGGGSRTRHRRQDRRRRKYRPAPRCGAGPAGSDGQRVEGTHRSSDRIDADADCRVPAADHHYRSDRNFLQRACHRHECRALTSLVLALVWTSNLGHAPDPARHGAQSRRRLTEHGFFGRIVRFYERWVRRSLEHPVFLGVFCVLLIAVSYLSYRQLGMRVCFRRSMKAGSFSTTSCRRAVHFRKPIGFSTMSSASSRDVPEVESTSRRTGLQLGVFPVTEPNTGDFAVKLKDERKRGIDDVISDIRDKITKPEPALDVEFVQLLQDMIGDLTGAPQPVVVKLFSDNADLLKDWAPQVGDALMNVEDRRQETRSSMSKMESRTPPAARPSSSTSIPRAPRGPVLRRTILAIATTAIMEGEPATQPVIVNDRPYTLRVRYPAANRASLEAMSNTMLVNSNGATSTLGFVDRHSMKCRARRKSCARICSVSSMSPRGWKTSIWAQVSPQFRKLLPI